MNHASVELIEAMRGETPCGAISRGAEDRTKRAWLVSACGGRPFTGTATALLQACRGFPFESSRDEPEDEGATEDVTVVDCPACLAIVATAVGPERTYQLLVRADEQRMEVETGGATLKDLEAA